ncbi:MAG: hypothetical protein ACYDGR_07940 [Candidatus Dormibacteria bacterium]
MRNRGFPWPPSLAGWARPQTILAAGAAVVALVVVGVTFWPHPAATGPSSVNSSPSPSPSFSEVTVATPAPGVSASAGNSGGEVAPVSPSPGQGAVPPTIRPSSGPTSYPEIQITQIAAVCRAGQARLTFSVVAPSGAPQIRSIEVFLDTTPATLNPTPAVPTRGYRGDATGVSTDPKSRWNVQVFDQVGREFGLGTPAHC